MTTIYIAGPMTGHPNFNREAFHDAATRLRAAGYHVINPAETPIPCQDPSWVDWTRASLKRMLDADGLALLPGWHKSRGASIEYHVAIQLGMRDNTVDGWMTAITHTQEITR